MSPWQISDETVHTTTTAKIEAQAFFFSEKVGGPSPVIYPAISQERSDSGLVAEQLRPLS
jgi:hypothetical protein